ncbi:MULTISPECIES: dihydroneopterin triphosphate diphosphatase [Ectothiorhodospira]|uniref:dATP pyrophosphohydrolase n=1 Tax=Ectothiorhodospira marina TaxID=1396821 RepID=A0A1H7HGX0_9GAMM|nr:MULTISPECIES: dihydroneopterin triphosphate diphosphatase [Ectothiorhodospira]MCG5517063.1 dihydroneopterin triphosphate diphosphatase [Ectothiorhodospira sp. 9100]MCG5517743.1 dihydroneopterin triphosphate diphosphatase [Ectothiorhodospira sp. 9905]SEK49561.1 dATP pyrophosphohydrolase [Ectothiorhodospira marina]
MVFKRPESVLVVVHDEAGRVLLLRRRIPADFWQSVTGSLEWGESPVQAARRELEEETGLCADGLVNLHRQVRFPIVSPWRERYPPDADENLEHHFTLRVPAGTAIRLSLHEHGEYCWLPRDEAARQVASWTNAEAILNCVPKGLDSQDA